MNWWQQHFFQVALPIIITCAVAVWYQSRRVDLRDSMNRRFAAVERRRITLKESTSPLGR